MQKNLKEDFVESIEKGSEKDMIEVSERFFSFALEWTWLMINLPTISKELNKSVLLEKMQVHQDLVLNFEMVDIFEAYLAQKFQKPEEGTKIKQMISDLAPQIRDHVCLAARNLVGSLNDFEQQQTLFQMIFLDKCGLLRSIDQALEKE